MASLDSTGLRCPRIEHFRIRSNTSLRTNPTSCMYEQTPSAQRPNNTRPSRPSCMYEELPTSIYQRPNITRPSCMYEQRHHACMNSLSVHHACMNSLSVHRACMISLSVRQACICSSSRGIRHRCSFIRIVSVLPPSDSRAIPQPVGSFPSGFSEQPSCIRFGFFRRRGGEAEKEIKR